MLKPLNFFRSSCSQAFVAFTLCATTASATTTLTSANFDLDSDATWSAGVPSVSGDPVGQINADYNFDDLGSGNVNGNFDASGLGVVSITQTAGNGLGDQYNVYNNTNFTFNLNGGSMTSDGGTFILNGTKFNVAGGSLSTLEFRTASGSSMTVSNGSFTASLISLRGGTFTQTGGTVTSNHGGPVFNRANTNTTLNLTGGDVVAGTGNNNALIQHTGIFATIGGGFSANLPAAVNVFAGGIHTNSSTINFTSDWTGSLSLDPATAWDDVFEAGDVSVSGIELGPNDFETYFQNSSGVITLHPVSSGSVTVSTTVPTLDTIASNNSGTTFSKINDEDASSNHARGQLLYLPNVPSGGYQITGVTIHKNGNQVFSNDTVTVHIFEGAQSDWDTGTGHDTPTDGSNYYVDTTVTDLYSQAFTINGLIANSNYVTFEFTTPVVVSDNSNLGFLLTYDESAPSSPDFFQYNEGETAGRVQITTTDHSTADNRHIRYFIHGDAFDGGFPGTDDDMDGLADAWERVHFGNLDQIGTDNLDGDGLDNAAEQTAGTDPNLADTDGDGLDDDVEVVGVTDPIDPDSDDDGLLDGVESDTGIFVSNEDTGTNPILDDTDHDGTNDSIEITLGTDPSDETHQPAERPNIVFIMIDDLDTREIGVYGQATLKTPRIDTMASQGMMFTDYYTASPVCHSARSCLMTGQDSRRAQDSANSTLPLAAERITIAEVLKQAGYTTGCVGKWGLGEANTVGAPWNQGFDFFCGYLSQTNAHRFFPKFLWKNDQKIYFDQTLATSEGGSLYIPGAQNFNAVTDDWDDAVGNVCSHDVVVSEGLQFIEDNADKPFFLYCAWTPPHAYFYNAATVEALTDADGLVYDHTDPDQTLLEELYPGAPFGTDGQGRPKFIPHVYATMVSAADRDVGRIMDKLVELDIDDKTLVIFCSDNGEDEPTFLTAAHLKPGYQDLRGLKRDLYEGGIRSPFVAWWPGVVPTNTSSDVIGTFADMLPTFADIAGLSTPVDITGRSILPALLGGSEADLQPRDYHFWHFNLQNLRLRAVRQGDMKVVRSRANDGSAPTYEMFNLASDPYETTDLSGTQTGLLDQLIPLVEGTHEVLASTYFRADDEFFTWTNMTPDGFQIGPLDGSGASYGYSLSSGGTGYGFNYLPFETGLSEPATFTSILQFPSGGVGSLLLGATNNRTESLVIRIDSDSLLLEVRDQSGVLASDNFNASDFPDSRAEITVVIDPNSGVGEVQLGALSLPFNVGSSIAPLQFWGYEVESTTIETSRPQWRLGTLGNCSIQLLNDGSALFGHYQFPFAVGDTIVPQYSYDLQNWYDNPPGLIDLGSSQSQGEVSGSWMLEADSLLARNSDDLFLRYTIEQ